MRARPHPVADTISTEWICHRLQDVIVSSGRLERIIMWTDIPWRALAMVAWRRIHALLLRSTFISHLNDARLSLRRRLGSR